MTSKLQPVTLQDVQTAKSIISRVVPRTAISFSQSATAQLDCEMFLKLENQQKTGSFKVRGAYNKVHALSDAEKKRGIIASSAGNHAQGVAYAANLLGVQATIVMPTTAPLVKIQATKSYGANVVLAGDFYDEAFSAAQELARDNGYVFVHPYEDEKVIAGQGTLALEVLEDLSELDSIIVPIGGGGLISGIATVVKAMRPKCKVYGVQAKGCPAMAESFHAKHIVNFDGKVSTIADGIAVKTPSKQMYEQFISKLVDDVVTISDDQIAESMVWLMERAKAVVEGSGAVSLAAAFHAGLKLGKKSCVVLSGGNVDMNMISKVIELGLRRKGRLAKLVVAVEDVPGTLSRLTTCIAQHKANVLEIHHDRVSQGLFLRETIIEILLETNSVEHIEQIKASLTSLGARVL